MIAEPDRVLETGYSSSSKATPGLRGLATLIPGSGPKAITFSIKALNDGSAKRVFGCIDL
jgi:hypothetical protein